MEKIVARPGHSFVTLDLCQPLLRLAALFSSNAFLCKALVEKQDIHSQTARLIWGEQFDRAELTQQKKMRLDSKLALFDLLYGRGQAAPRLVEQISEHLDGAVGIIESSKVESAFAAILGKMDDDVRQAIPLTAKVVYHKDDAWIIECEEGHVETLVKILSGMSFERSNEQYMIPFPVVVDVKPEAFVPDP